MNGAAIESSTVQVVIAGLLALGLLWLLLRLYGAWRQQQRKQRQLVNRINALLPQTQCGQCSYEGCLPYARAIASGEAINQCPPGGAETILALSRLLNELPESLNPAHGQIAPRKVAIIREQECIGCTKCIRACPVDAIVGGPKLMHTVIASECTGCDLCIAPCPVDCIDLVPADPVVIRRNPLPMSTHSVLDDILGSAAR